MESSEAQFAQFLKLGEFGQLLKRRWLPASIVFIVVFALVTMAGLSKKSTYVAEGKLLIQRVGSTSPVTGLAREISELDALEDRGSPLDTEIEILISVPMVQNTIEKLKLTNTEGETLKYTQFLSNIGVNKLRAGDIIKVSYEQEDPEKAAAVVNTWLDLYIENNTSINRSEAMAARESLEKEVPAIEASVLKAERELRQFKEQNNLVALEQEASSALEMVTDLQKQINAAQSQIANTNTQFDVLRNQLGMDPQQAGTSTSLSQSSGIQELLQELQQAEALLVVEQTRFAPGHPTILSLQDQITALQNLLQRRVGKAVDEQEPAGNSIEFGNFQQELTRQLVTLEANRLGLASQINALNQLQASYQQRLKILPKLEQQQNQLERQLELAQANYAQLLQKLQETGLTENLNVVNARIISPALVPEKAVGIPKLFLLMLATLLASFLSVVSVLFLEARDPAIRTVEQVRKQFPFNLLGVIPLFEQSELTSLDSEDSQMHVPKILARYMQDYGIRKAYQQLRDRLKFFIADKKIKTLVVTSAVTGEGKSEIAAHLAMAITETGQRVLLIDAAMRQPQQHEIWELSNQIGLSHVIVSEAELDNAIQEVIPGLDVLAAGGGHANPIALLDSQHMASLIDWVAANYNIIIVDTHALNDAADASLLGKMVDGIVLVARTGVVDFRSAALAAEMLQQSGQNVIGLAVNGVISHQETRNYSHNELGSGIAYDEKRIEDYTQV